MGEFDSWEEIPGQPDAVSRAQVMRVVRNRLAQHLYDEAPAPAEGFAIYSLSDPRDLRAIRYVGQARSPRRRYLQHVNTARLWLPDVTPWWIAKPDVRPLYDWIRGLYREEQRLPVMVVSLRVTTAAAARYAERSYILDLLHANEALLNVESEIMGRRRARLASRTPRD